MIPESKGRTRKRRSAAKQDKLAASLRKRIITGKYPPGGQLPTQRELAQRFGVSGTTVQQALLRLAREGFVQARTIRGTTVVDHPPHLCEYGWVFQLKANDEAWKHTQFSLAVRRSVEDMSRPPERSIRQFFGVDSHPEQEDYQKLRHDLAAKRLAGVIFHDPYHFRLTPLAGLLNNHGVPMVGIMSGHWSPPVPNLVGVTHQRGVVERALDWLRDRGRRRVAAICISGDGDEFIHELERAAAERDIITHPHWIHGGHPPNRTWVRHVIHLLMHDGHSERPDALLITDDNLVEEATLGLRLAGVRVPQELDIVAHANFPYPTRSLCQAKRLGYDARNIVSTCLDLIDRRRRGQMPPPLTEIPVVFDHELADAVRQDQKIP